MTPPLLFSTLFIGSPTLAVSQPIFAEVEIQVEQSQADKVLKRPQTTFANCLRILLFSFLFASDSSPHHHNR